MGFNRLLREIKTYYLQKLMGKQVNINLKITFQDYVLNVSIKKHWKAEVLLIQTIHQWNVEFQVE